MENRFHLAIPAGDLDKAIKFYCEVLGCERGDAEVNNKSIKYIGRKESASTATGLFKKHLQEQEQILETLLKSKA